MIYQLPLFKTCVCCGEIKPLTPDQFYKEKKSFDGFQATCGCCVRAWTSARNTQYMRELNTYKSTEAWHNCLRYWGYACAICGRKADVQFAIAMDHWVPWAKGGPTNATNIIPLCHRRPGTVGDCHQTKRDQLPEPWLIGLLGEVRARAKLEEIVAYFEWVRQQNL